MGKSDSTRDQQKANQANAARALTRAEKRLAATLVADKTTGENLRWATDSYASLGEGFGAADQLTVDCVAGMGSRPLAFRAEKSAEEQVLRTRAQAEVFTPAWVCNEQNNLLDDAWFGHPSPFNVAVAGGWVTNRERIPFGADHGWQRYVDKRVLEVACGEAAYLASRYDSVTGEPIPFDERIGLLDRKLRVARENAANDDEWDAWTLRAFQATYGFDYQGDNVLLARENLLATFDEHSVRRPGGPPTTRARQEITNVICWNIFQMDGRTFEVPFAARPAAQMSLFGGMGETQETEPVPCLVYDWRARKPVEYKSLLRRHP